MSLAYSDILNESSATFVSQLIPAAIIGNMFAIVSAGYMKRLGEKKPELSGNGVLVKTDNQAELLKNKIQRSQLTSH